jgi:hypothetical protein
VRQGGKSNWLNHYFNTAAFTTNPAGTFGNSGKNMLQGPPIKTMDAAIAKNWIFHERYSFQFRWEMFNAFNTPSFSNPGNTVGFGNFGQITSVGAIPPRVMQAGLKFAF